MRRNRELACRDVAALLSDHLDGQLDRGARERVQAHLRSCGNCAAYLEQLRLTIALTGTLLTGEAEPAPGYLDALRAAVRGGRDPR